MGFLQRTLSNPLIMQETFVYEVLLTCAPCNLVIYVWNGDFYDSVGGESQWSTWEELFSNGITLFYCAPGWEPARSTVAAMSRCEVVLPLHPFEINLWRGAFGQLLRWTVALSVEVPALGFRDITCRIICGGDWKVGILLQTASIQI